MKNKKVLVFGGVVVATLVILVIGGLLLFLSGQSKTEINYLNYCSDETEAINICDGYAEVISMNPGAIQFILEDGTKIDCPIMPLTDLSDECQEYMTKDTMQCDRVECVDI
jgi:hypothetical protein